jgi:hypothetical protein
MDSSTMKTVIVAGLLFVSAPVLAAGGWALHENNGPVAAARAQGKPLPPPTVYKSNGECNYVIAKLRGYRPPGWSATCQQQGQ